MSVRVMSAVWALSLPDSQKIVLLALADSANDEGHCWPSMRSLVVKTSKGERTVQGVIKELCDAGHLTRREVPGKGCNYSVHPRSACAPAEDAPAQGKTGTPAAPAPHPRSACGQTVKEPSENQVPPAPQGGEARRERTLIPEDWKLPAVADLPPKARACAEQWTTASYETHGEAYRLYWRSERKMKADWRGTWANRVIALHSQVLRDQKFGNAAPDGFKAPADPNAGTLLRRYQAGEISFEEFDQARRTSATGPPRAIGQIVRGLGAAAQ